MDKIIVIFIDSIIMNFGLILVSSSFLDKRLYTKKKKFWYMYLMFVLYVTLSYTLIDNFIRIIPTIIFLILFIYKIYDVNFQKSISSSFISMILLLFAEIIYAIFSVVIFKLDMQALHATIFGNLFSNIMIVIIFVIISKLKFIKNICRQFINYTLSSKAKSFFFFIIMLQLVVTMILYYLYFDVKLEYALVMCFALIIVYIIIGLKYLKERDSYLKLGIEYNSMLGSLAEYEKLYSYQRMLNHEFKNDIMVIRGMTNKNNKKLLTYIDELVDFKNNKNDKWLDNLKRLPEGGLLGILYYKLLSMEKENININFEIGRNFEAKNYVSIPEETKNKLCKLLGIYLDNAIQAVKNINDKNISITINEKDEFISFSIDNNFSGNVDLFKINDKGYTTNEKGRGYGLAIAKEIIESDDNIINNTQIIGSVFSQEIKIKIKM